jgi:hypothetical protein
MAAPPFWTLWPLIQIGCPQRPSGGAPRALRPLRALRDLRALRELRGPAGNCGICGICGICGALRGQGLLSRVHRAGQPISAPQEE